MPVGRVKWYDPERGFGFASNPGEHDVYVSRQVLPEGVEELYSGQRIEFDFASGRGGRAPEALRVKVLDAPRRQRHQYRAEDLHGMISDLMTVLEQRVQPGLRSGRYPDRKEGHKIAEALRVVAKELDV